MILRKGLTLIEVLVVIMIVAILASVSVPILRKRIDAAKWTEAKSIAGSIRRAADAYCSEKGTSWTGWGSVSISDLGFMDGEINGKYFSEECYSISLLGFKDYLITIDASSSTTGKEPSLPSQITLDEDGNWTESD